MNFVLRICIIWICICANISAQADVLPSLTGMFPPIFPTEGFVQKIMEAPKDISNVWSALKLPTFNNQITVSTTPYVNVSRKEKIHSNYYTNIQGQNRSKRSKTIKTTDELIKELFQLTSEETNQSGDCHKTITKIKNIIAQLEPVLIQMSRINEENVNEKAEETTQYVEDQTEYSPREQAPSEVEAQIANPRNSLMQNSEAKNQSEEASTTSSKRIECSSNVADTVHKKTRRHNSKIHKKSAKAIKESDEESLDESDVPVIENPQKRRAKKKKTRHVRDTKYSSTTPAPMEEATEDNPRKSEESTTTEATLLTTPSTVSTTNLESSTQASITDIEATISSLDDSIITKKSEEEINDSTVATISPTSTNNPIKEVTTAKIDTSIQPTSTDNPVENSTTASIFNNNNTNTSTINPAVTEENKIETSTEKPESVTTIKTTTLQDDNKNVEKSVEDKVVNLPKSTQRDKSDNDSEGAGTLVEKSRRKRSENKPTTKDKSKLKIDLNELPEFFRTLSIQQAINQGIDENHKPAPIPLTIKLDNPQLKPVKSTRKDNTSLENRLRLIEENYQKIQKSNKILRERQKLLEERLRREEN